jgi:hypothetical protein
MLNWKIPVTKNKPRNPLKEVYWNIPLSIQVLKLFIRKLMLFVRQTTVA